MSRDLHAAFGTPFGQNRVLQILVVVYLLVWTVAAIQPLDRQTWALENLLVAAATLLLISTHRAFVFSRLSYLLIFLFLLLHVAGSHYTYSAVPAAEWLSQVFDLERNHYDRFVHFAFGLLLAYPAREIAMRTMHVHGVWSFVVPVLVIVTLGSVYEMIESWAARIVSPDVGIAFVGAQGDIWDGQKDMTLALSGSMIAMLVTGMYRRWRLHEPYVAFR